jgi:DNA ligase-1
MRKIDGERIMLIFNRGDFTLLNRRNNKKNEYYPEINREEVKQFGGYPKLKNIILDGEIACEDGFNALQHRTHNSNKLKVVFLMKEYPVIFYVFDILYYNNQDLRNWELKSRWNFLLTFSQTKHIRICPYFYFDELKIALKSAKKGKWEGLIFKKLNSVYKAERNENWIKYKFWKEVKTEILGYNEGKIGSLKTKFGDVGLLNEKNRDYYLKNKPKYCIVQYLEFSRDKRFRFPILKEFV